MNAEEILDHLQSLANPANVAGMSRYGINPKGTLGVSIPVLRKIAREVGKDHGLAEDLWVSGIHEARILAGFIDRPDMATEDQMERWVRDFDARVDGREDSKESRRKSQAIHWVRQMRRGVR